MKQDLIIYIVLIAFIAAVSAAVIAHPADKAPEAVAETVTPTLIFADDVTKQIHDPTPEPTHDATPTPKPTKRVDSKTGYVEGKTYTMRIYHYCACRRCTPGTGITASGKRAEVGMVAMYGLPFGTIIEINGREYVVEDRGVGIGTVDIFCETHAETDKKGTYKAKVKIVKLG